MTQAPPRFGEVKNPFFKTLPVEFNSGGYRTLYFESSQDTHNLNLYYCCTGNCVTYNKYLGYSELVIET